MDNLGRFCRELILDFAVIALAGGVLAGMIFSETLGISFSAGALWLALNTALLGWLIGALLTPKERSRVLVFALACAKIPAAYLLLYWLFSRDYLDVRGLAAGVAMLPVAIVFRGLRSLSAKHSQDKTRGIVPRG